MIEPEDLPEIESEDRVLVRFLFLTFLEDWDLPEMSEYNRL
jgi:hypothetical protein